VYIHATEISVSNQKEVYRRKTAISTDATNPNVPCLGHFTALKLYPSSILNRSRLGVLIEVSLSVFQLLFENPISKRVKKSVSTEDVAAEKSKANGKIEHLYRLLACNFSNQIARGSKCHASLWDL
jgi:hypothetical protein